VSDRAAGTGINPLTRHRFGRERVGKFTRSGGPARGMWCRMCQKVGLSRLDSCPLFDQRGICLECHEALHPGRPDGSP